MEKWQLVDGGDVVATYDSWSKAYDAMEAYVGGDDYCTRESCDGNATYGYADEEAASAADCSDCAYGVCIRRA